MATLLFDLDGTLTNSALGISRCIKHALDEMEISYDKNADFSKYVGPPLAQTFAVILNSNDADLIDNAVQIYRDRFAAIGMFENSLYPGVVEAVKALAPHNDLYVVTSKPEIYAEKIVEHFGLGSHFRRVYGSGLNEKNHDKTQLLGQVLREIDYQPQQTHMIGDRRFDIAAGRNHGVGAIAVSWGYGALVELQKAQADIIVDSAEQLLSYLSSLQCQSTPV